MEVSLQKLQENSTSNMFKDNESKEWLLSAIRKDIVEVKFEKKDGSVRDMRCTLNGSAIPADKTPKVSEEVTPSASSAVRVFDVDKQEWRSFRWDSVKSFKFGI